MARRFLSYSYLLLITLTIIGCGNPPQKATPSQASVDFSTVDPFVRSNGTSLVLGDAPYYFAGANQYYFFYKNTKMIDEVLTNAQALGLTVMRTWAFCEGALHGGFCFQPSPGVYDESTFRNLDYTIAKASQLGIKLILTLGNNWGGYDHFGGTEQYLAWIGSGLNHDDFYRRADVKELYRNYVRYVLNRTNTITNVAYKDDPTILIWEIINEPRADDKQALYAWIDEMAGFVKSIDPHHLVSSGSEGTYGSDFYETNKSKNIDVASLHLYPELWGFSIDQANSYLNDHIRIARDRLKKPLYLGEFGLRSGIVDRPEIYRKWYDMMLGADVSGSLFWLLSGRQYGDAKVEGTPYPDYDGFSVYYPDSNDLCPIIQRHASAIATKRQSAMPKLLFRSQFPGTVAMTKN